MKRKKANFLIEMLVVIVIISILSAILYPFFAKAAYNSAKQNPTQTAWKMHKQDR